MQSVQPTLGFKKCVDFYKSATAQIYTCNVNYAINQLRSENCVYVQKSSTICCPQLKSVEM